MSFRRNNFNLSLIALMLCLLFLAVSFFSISYAEIKETNKPTVEKTEEKTLKNKKAEDVENSKLPKLVMEETSYDFGEMIQQNRREHIFKIKNEGDADLIIKDIRTSCGCTAAMVSSSVIKPGSTGEMRVIFSSKRFNGEVHRQISFSSNDPNHKTVTLKIRALVKALLEARPAYLAFGKIIASNPSHKTLKLKNMTAAPVNLEKISSRDKHIVIGDYKKLLNPNEATEIDFTYQPEGKGPVNPRAIFGNIEISIKGKQQKLTVPYSGQLVGEIQCIPRNVGFNVVRKNKDVRRKIAIKNFGTKELKLTKIEIDNKVVTTDFKTPYIIKPGDTAKIFLKPSKELKEGSFRSTVKIYTDNKDYPELSANVYGVVKGEKKTESKK